MCTAIFKPKNIVIDPKVLQKSFLKNPHGAGIAYVDQDKVKVQKGFFTLEDFFKAYDIISSNKAMLIHFRLASMEPIDEINCHPWIIDDNHCMIHQGYLSNQKLYDKNLSDTGNFVNEVLIPNKDKLFDEQFKLQIENKIGIFNQIVILNSNEEIIIYNENYGKWINEYWIS